MSGRQIEIRTAGPCRHPKAVRQPIENGRGTVIADRCGSCHRIVGRRLCRGCDKSFRATESSLRHGRAYCTERCRQKAARGRAKQRRAGLENIDVKQESRCVDP